MNTNKIFFSLGIAMWSVALLLSACASASDLRRTVQPEIYAQVSGAVGNIAYAADGDLVYSQHPFYDPAVRVLRYDAQTKSTSPFPNAAWNTAPGEGQTKDSNTFLSTVLGIRTDQSGKVVWMLDMGFRNQIVPKFVGWNTESNELVGIIEVPAPASLPTSQLNDFVIDDTHGVFIIADEDIGPGGDGSRAALVVVERQSGKSYRRLEGHFSTVPDAGKPLVFGGKPLLQPGGGQPILVGADSIVADSDDEWLYYAPLNGDTVYRVRISDLLDSSLNEEALARKVERYAWKENNGGMSIDIDGNLYLTNLESHSIGLVPAGRVEGQRASYRYAQHPKMQWPDGASTGPDGYMYVGAAQLQLAPAFNNGADHTSKPFLIFRFRPLGESILGR